MSLQTPRVFPEQLHSFHPNSAGQRTPHTVRILGTVSALHGDTATVTCGDHGDVTLLLKPDSHLQMGKLVEVVGKVTDVEGGKLGLRVLGTTDWGNPADCDYKIFEQVVNATQLAKAIFFDAE